MTLSTAACIAVAVVAGLVSWAALGVADFNALYKMELSMPPVPPDLTWLGFVQSRQDEFWRFLNPATIPLYLLPALALWSLHGFRKSQLVLLAAVFALCGVDLVQLTSFEGGDRKGCEGCLAWFLLHILLAGGCVLAFLGACALRGKRALDPDHDT